ncbi:MAG: anthranilate phosphoribosyltransferase [Piscinibacter sp.]|nr:anthranilate phosphoribosyltransferase [Piscinibacter sp.]MCC7200780.1 anthranilate phosphoribosyltransferase [Gammaproteobacteria bacterium]
MSRAPREVLEQLLERHALAEQEAFDLLVTLTDPQLAPAMAGALLAALRSKGITADEVRGFARGMRSLARRPNIPPGSPVADVVGTGGDSSHSFNLSTGTSLLVAAAGVRIVKHGNRSVSSRSGSADVLEALGLRMPLDEAEAGRCLAATGFTFLFAPHYHPAMKAIAPVRAALGVRTVFNLLGPLTNPAEPPFGVIGAWNAEIADLMANTIAGMPIERVFVVHGETGWDEPTPAAPFLLWDVRPGSVRRSRRDASDYGLPVCTGEDLRGGDAAHNAAMLAQVLRGQDRGPHRDALLMGAALVLEVTGLAEGPLDAVAQAAAAIDDGRAAALLERLAAFDRERSR